MKPILKYDAAIVGGGLAGLALSIQLARMGHSVILFEKERFPFHKVCGEYISMESWDFLSDLGIDLDNLGVAMITRLTVSGVNGSLLHQKLPLGGFGISRYVLDHVLMKLAMDEGVIIKEQARVSDIQFNGNEFNIDAGDHSCTARVAAGCFGKRSNIDIKWKRPFASHPQNKLNNYVGIKYHIRSSLPANTIALHNFPYGYCGLSKIEEDKFCLCYLTTARNLLDHHGNIPKMESAVLWQNPHLQRIWKESRMIYEEPLTISQISFEKKSQVEKHVMMVGDAAGMITPLCGNGMSMALHGSKLAAKAIQGFLDDRLSREAMEDQYAKTWHSHFSSRLRTGRRIQRLFGKKWITNAFVGIAKSSPFLVNSLIRKTHGKTF
jgi:flavin-dependent dehydrogenase